MELHTADLIKAYIDAEPDKQYKSWRASSIGGCPRAHFYLRKGVEQTIPKTDITLRKFKAGDIFHDFIEDVTAEQYILDFLLEERGIGVAMEYARFCRAKVDLKMAEFLVRAGDTKSDVEGQKKHLEIARKKLLEEGVGVEVELLPDKDLNLGGRYDLLLRNKERSQLRDIKSQHSGMFHRLQREAKEILGKPLEDSSPEERQAATKEAFEKKYFHQVMQLAAYMILLKRAGTPVDEGVIVRVSKDDLSLAEVHFELTPELERKVTDEVVALNKHWKENTLPDCTCSESDWGTRYCSFGDPDSEKRVPVEGKNYSRVQITACCSEELYEGA